MAIDSQSAVRKKGTGGKGVALNMMITASESPYYADLLQVKAEKAEREKLVKLKERRQRERREERKRREEEAKEGIEGETLTEHSYSEKWGEVERSNVSTKRDPVATTSSSLVGSLGKDHVEKLFTEAASHTANEKEKKDVLEKKLELKMQIANRTASLNRFTILHTQHPREIDRMNISKMKQKFK